MLIGQIIHPDHGDITMDVARELAAIRQQDDQEIASEAEARQALIASAMGQEARTFRGGHQVAQIDARVYDYWRRREGPDFWRNELKYMLKRHPSLRVVARTEKPSIIRPALPADRKTQNPVARRGRWAA